MPWYIVTAIVIVYFVLHCIIAFSHMRSREEERRDQAMEDYWARGPGPGEGEE